MGGRGGSLGGSQGTARVTARAAAPAATAAPAPTPAATQPQYNIDDFSYMTETQISMALDQIFTQTTVDRDQQNSDTQRFFNAIGWADRKPQVLDENAYENARRSSGARSWYHTDDTAPGVSDASKFSKQYMGGGRQFLSGGIHGDGTYWARSSGGSWRYGTSRKASQIKGFLNSKARVIKEADLDRKIDQWRSNNPAAYYRIANASGGYRNGIRGTKSILAAMFGYNVIDYPSAGYRTILDRSVTTVSSTFRHRGSTTDLSRNW